MAYGSGPLTKLGYAKILAATLAHVILGQRDAVSLGLFGDGRRQLFPRTDTPQRLPWLLETLAGAQAAGPTGLAGHLARFAPAIRRRSLVVVFSDFLEDEAGFLAILPQLRFQGCEVIVVHVLDHAELELPFDDTVRFEGLEGEAPLTTRPADFRKSYREAVRDYCTAFRQGCERLDCHYVLADTSQPPAEVLGAYLAFRNRRHG